MLELRPTCEHCGRPLPPESTEARICSFECTFCERCVREVLGNVCPNCGGGFERRPVRPATDRKGGNFLGRYPATERVTRREVDAVEHRRLRDEVEGLPPESR